MADWVQRDIAALKDVAAVNPSSLDRLAAFTRKIVAVPKQEIQEQPKQKKPAKAR